MAASASTGASNEAEAAAISSSRSTRSRASRCRRACSSGCRRLPARSTEAARTSLTQSASLPGATHTSRPEASTARRRRRACSHILRRRTASRVFSNARSTASRSTILPACRLLRRGRTTPAIRRHQSWALTAKCSSLTRPSIGSSSSGKAATRARRSTACYRPRHHRQGCSCKAIHRRRLFLLRKATTACRPSLRRHRLGRTASHSAGRTITITTTFCHRTTTTHCRRIITTTWHRRMQAGRLARRRHSHSHRRRRRRRMLLAARLRL